MTIIQPSKSRQRGKGLFWALIGVIVVFSGFSIIAYNEHVDLKFSIESAEETIARLTVENADLEDQLYTVLDFSNLDDLVRELGLVKEGTPDYFLALLKSESR